MIEQLAILVYGVLTIVGALVTLGAGGESGGVHTTEEWYDNHGGPVGIERALLTTLAVAELAVQPAATLGAQP